MFGSDSLHLNLEPISWNRLQISPNKTGGLDSPHQPSSGSLREEPITEDNTAVLETAATSQLVKQKAIKNSNGGRKTNFTGYNRGLCPCVIWSSLILTGKDL